MAKTLTVKNPWAYLICTGIKNIENRSRKTNFRGTILIHSSKVNDKRSLRMANLLTEEQWRILPIKNRMEMSVEEFYCSSIIGQVDIVDCVQDSNSVWAEPGQWHWVLANARMYSKPLPNIKGQLGIWNYKPDSNSWEGMECWHDKADHKIVVYRP